MNLTRDASGELGAVVAIATGVLVACALGRSAVPTAALAAAPPLAAGRLAPRSVAGIAIAGLLATLLAGALAGELLSATNVTALLAVAAAGAAALWIAGERDLREDEHDRAEFLGEAATVLLSCPDREATIQAAASLPVPLLADWCAVDLVASDGTMRRRAVRHIEPEFEEAAWRLGERAGPFANGAAEVLRTARPQLWPEVPERLLTAAARDDQHLADLLGVGVGSALIVPLRTVDRTIGAMTLVSRAPGAFTPGDVELLEDLARRCAIAIVNAGPDLGPPVTATGRFRRGTTSPAGPTAESDGG